MAEEDEIDVLGDFSFNSCFAQNNQGIPSCSNREDTVHPQWLLDSTATNWYDMQNKDSCRLQDITRTLSESSSVENYSVDNQTAWTRKERDLLVNEMAKYGRNIIKISQAIKTKTQAEIQAFIDAEYGVNLETALFGLDKNDDQDDVPTVVQEEIVTDEITSINNMLNMVATASPTVRSPKKPPRKNNRFLKSKNSLLKPDAVKETGNAELLAINPSEIFYEDDLMLGSTQSIGSDMDSMDIISKNIVKYQKNIKPTKKVGNHRKISRKFDKRSRNRSKDALKSPVRQRNNSNLSEEGLKNPIMQIILGSGQALPLSEGEQVIKIEKKKESEPESDIDIDVDSDNDKDKVSLKNERPENVPVTTKSVKDEPSTAIPLSKFEPMPRRQKKINLDGGGGYTIMHTESGDLYAIGAEPRKERAPRKKPIHLIRCRHYSAEKPAPFEVRLHVSTLITMDAHAHTSRGEVMGLVGGRTGETLLTLTAYRKAAAAAGHSHCDMDPVSQSLASEYLQSIGLSLCGWHHSHPTFGPSPSALDLRSQSHMQAALDTPMLAVITSQHWPTGRRASQFRCVRIEDDDADSPDTDTPAGYQFSVKLLPDLTVENLVEFLRELRAVLREDNAVNEYSIDMTRDVCPEAGMTYLEKCISSVRHHMQSAGYSDEDPVVEQLVQGLRDIFR